MMLYITPASSSGGGSLEAPIVPTLLNSWGAQSGESPPGYWKEPNGKVVHVRGSLENGTIGAAYFVLPVGYRPLTYRRGVMLGGGAAVARYDIEPGGSVIQATGTNTSPHLGNILFRIDA